jgi:hypothetical protein
MVQWLHGAFIQNALYGSCGMQKLPLSAGPACQPVSLDAPLKSQACCVSIFTKEAVLANLSFASMLQAGHAGYVCKGHADLQMLPATDAAGINYNSI